MMEQEVIIVVLSVALLLAVYRLWRNRSVLSKLRKGDRMKMAFLNNISHEIRTPLKSVHEMADVVAKPDLYLSKNEKLDIADQLHYNANLISTLLDEVLVFTDADAAGHQLKFEMFSPNALCRRCLEANMHSIYHREAVKLSFKRELNDEFFVKSDRHMVELILNKLILNACRFTEKGEIVAGCNVSEQVGRLTIYVSDTGMGIPENRLDSLFSWFEAPDDMRDEAELDLSICQKMAQKLGGSLRVEPNPRQGTRIMLVLPLH